jgi:hypothetical protein
VASPTGALLRCGTTLTLISNVMLQSYHCHHDLVTECMIANTGQHDIVDNVSNYDIVLEVPQLCTDLGWWSKLEGFSRFVIQFPKLCPALFRAGQVECVQVRLPIFPCPPRCHGCPSPEAFPICWGEGAGRPLHGTSFMYAVKGWHITSAPLQNFYCDIE